MRRALPTSIGKLTLKLKRSQLNYSDAIGRVLFSEVYLSVREERIIRNVIGENMRGLTHSAKAAVNGAFIAFKGQPIARLTDI
jgi:hypothetical protein